MQTLLKVLLAILFYTGGIAVAEEETIVAVAANMARTIDDIQVSFEKSTGRRLKISLGSSGSLSHQIIHGAPFAVFLSADRTYIDTLIEKNKTSGPHALYASGRLCFFIPNTSPLADSDRLETLISRLSHGEFNRLVIANPLHAPYGHAARTALQRAGIWALETRKLVTAENIAQALQFALSGSVDIGIVAWSHYLSGDLEQSGRCLPIPPYWHDPIEQHMILLHETDDTAAKFFQYMQSDVVKQILTEHGYLVP